jgi:hypothetical protein
MKIFLAFLALFTVAFLAGVCLYDPKKSTRQTKVEAFYFVLAIIVTALTTYYLTH